MKNKCQKFEEFLFESKEQSISEELSAAWKNHIAECKDCQAQWQAHQYLTDTLGRFPEPKLSEDFINRVRFRAYQEHSIRAPQDWALFFLRLYWIATTFVTFFLLFKINWSLISIKNAWFMILLLGIIFASPLLIIRRSRITLFDLVLRLWG